MKKTVVYSLLDQITVSGGNFFTIIICANLLSVFEQGKFSYVIACYMAIMLLSVAAVFNGASVLVNEIKSKDHYRLALFIYQFFIASSVAALIMAMIYTFGSFIDWDITLKELWLGFCFLLTQQIADFDRRIRYVFEHPRNALCASLRVFPIRLTLLLLLAPQTLEEVLLILVVANFLAITVVLLQLIKMRANLGQRARHFKVMQGHFNFSKLIVVSAIYGWAWSYIPVFALGVLHGKNFVAILVTLRGITNVANILMEQVETVSSVVFARTAYKGGIEQLSIQVKQVLLFGGIIWFLGMLVLMFWGHEIVLILLNDVYAEFSYLLPISWLAFGIYFVGRVYSIKYRSLKLINVEYYAGLASVLAAVISIPMIQYFSILGAVWVYVCIAAVSMLTQYFVITQSVKEQKAG